MQILKLPCKRTQQCEFESDCDRTRWSPLRRSNGQENNSYESQRRTSAVLFETLKPLILLENY